MPGNHGIVKEKKKLIRMPKTEKKRKRTCLLAHGPLLKLMFCWFDLCNFHRCILGQVNESISVAEREVLSV